MGGGYWSGQLIVVQVQAFEVGELAEFGGYRSGQLVDFQVQGGYSLVGDANTGPVGDAGGVAGVAGAPGQEGRVGGYGLAGPVVADVDQCSAVCGQAGVGVGVGDKGSVGAVGRVQVRRLSLRRAVLRSGGQG